MTLEDDPRWYQKAVIYQVHVRAFADSNRDGIGDLPGLGTKLGYLQELGVNAVWLLPFYPSPLRDGGYDISDYTSIHPDYGSMRDFRNVVVIMTYITGQVSYVLVGLAWTYVAVRLVHSAIHLTSNDVNLRFSAYFSSAVVLLAMWGTLLVQLLRAAPV